jgi:hypothetical protein
LLSVGLRTSVAALRYDQDRQLIKKNENRCATSADHAYPSPVIEIGRRTRSQAPPPHVVFEALTDPDRDPYRQWLYLRDDEQRPRVLMADPPRALSWSSLWPQRPDALVEFHLAARPDGGTDLRWRLLVEEPAPEPGLIGHLRRRLNQLINADLRFTFGQ